MGSEFGMCTCPRCFGKIKVSKVPYLVEVTNDTITEKILLMPNGRSNRFEVKGTGGTGYKQVGKSEVTYDGTIPKTIRVKIQDEKGSEQSVIADQSMRVCPDCYEAGNAVYLHPLMGYHDCYIIALVGLKSSGKTSYASALMNTSCKNMLAKLLGPGAEVTEKCIGNQVVRKATQPNQIEFLGNFLIKRKGRRTIALIIIDVAGETFTKQSEGSGNTRFQAGYFDLVRKNADALLLIHDDRDVRTLSNAESGISTSGELNERLESIRYKDTPYLCVLTKADQLKKHAASQKNGILVQNHKPCVSASSPVFRDLLRDAERGREPAQLLARHMACSRQIFKDLVRSAVSISDDTPCFMVSAGIPDGQYLNTDYAYNVLMPIYYLLRSWL